MIPLPRDISRNDIHQWLRQGVCVYKDAPHYYLSAPDSSRPNVGPLLLEEVATGKRHSVPASNRADISAAWPLCGSLNLEQGYAIFLQRRQQKQYRRTYTDTCLSIKYPDKWSVIKRHGAEAARLKPMSRRVVLAAFSPMYFDYESAVAALGSGECTSAAISRFIILTGKPDLLTVYYNGNRCGIIREGVYTSDGREVSSARMFKLLQGGVQV